MSIEELKKDSEELAKIMGLATRQSVKNALIEAKANVDKKIVALELKASQAAERKAAAETKRYVSELNEYAWDQSDKFVKLFVTLEGVQNLDEANVSVQFQDHSMNLMVTNLNGRDYSLVINNLLEAIDVEKSYRKIKTGLVAIYMKKVHEATQWDHLTTIHKRLKEKKTEEENVGEGSEDVLLNVMKKMYHSGNAETKQMMAKAWTESQEKMRGVEF